MREIAKVKTFWNEKWVKVETPKPTKTSDYYISNYGKIKSVSKKDLEERLLKGSTLRGGYKALNIRLVGDKNVAIFVHKFVGEHFVPKGNEEREFVVHLDEDKNNNHWQNLKWVTRTELTQWQHDHGIFDSANKKLGSNAKLTETKVKLLKQRIKDGKTKKAVLARNFGITLVHLRRIESGQYWSHVTLDESGIKNI